MNANWINTTVRYCLTCLTVLGGFCVAFVLMIIVSIITIYHGCIKQPEAAKKLSDPVKPVQAPVIPKTPLQKSFEDLGQLEHQIQTLLDSWTVKAKKQESDFRSQMSLVSLDNTVRQHLVEQIQHGNLSVEFASNDNAHKAFMMGHEWFQTQKHVVFLLQTQLKINDEKRKLKSLLLDRAFKDSSHEIEKVVVSEIEKIRKIYDGKSVEILESELSEPERFLLEKKTQEFIQTRLQINFGVEYSPINSPDNRTLSDKPESTAKSEFGFGGSDT